MYEDLRTNHLSVISQDFINLIFSVNESNLRMIFQRESNTDFSTNEVGTYREIFSAILISFNQLNYLDETLATEFVVELLNFHSSNSSNVPSSPDHSDLNMSESSIYSDTTENEYQPETYRMMLSWFVLIYEAKFIFGNIHLSFSNLRFY
ncbi:hypothetical protein RF11_14493 [Thelohanellus kitauei]|uniref:Uncharacterized protein n=1 Tax=Thelohanellus kitauei TaxID=669202 RepID=A0A0C2N994_THEKT|nr:hypothetical protein RF11_14493 [Thelohanellus kitauei]